MQRYIAFLRAINVGGHTVKMDHLRALFESFGLQRVETFIASGNVVFEATGGATALEQKIEGGLRRALGYDVATFLRTPADVARIAAHAAFTPAEIAASQALNVAFLRAAPDAAGLDKLMARQTDIDAFHTHGREIYWLCRRKQSESTFSNAVLEKTLGAQATLRGLATVQKLAAKYG